MHEDIIARACKNEKFVARFWSNVSKGDGCWEWTGYIMNGYGSIGNSPSMRAHRVAWTLAFGIIPSGLCVCHKCDNSRCVRPEHLFLGTNRENIADMLAKGRHARGSSAPNSVLTDRLVQVIRNACRAGMSQSEVARTIGIAPSGVCRIMNRKLWGHVP